MRQICLIHLLFISLIFLAGCKKNKNDHERDTFQTAATATVGPVKLYTRNGEVTDMAVIQDFTTRRVIVQNGFIFNSTSETINPSTLKITFHNQNSARVERWPFSQTATSTEIREAEVTNVSDSVLLISEIDSIPMLAPNPSYCDEMSRMSLLFPFNRSCLPSGASVRQCKFRHTFPLIKKGAQFELPIMVILGGSFPQGGNCSFNAFAGVWNIFNSNVLTTLAFNDTIAVQIKRAVLRKL